MSIPYSTERVLDMVIRSLRASGLIADDVSAETIRNVPNNSTDGGLDALAATLNYGGVAGTQGDSIFSTTNFTVVVDSDDTDPSSGYYNYFGVARGFSSLPITDDEKWILQAGSFINYPFLGTFPYLTVGPNAIDATADRKAALNVGYDFTNTKHFLQITGADDATTRGRGVKIEGSYTTQITSGSNLFFSGNGRVDFTDNSSPPETRGGFTSLSTAARFFIGDDNTDNVLYYEAIEDSSADTHFQIRAKREAGVTPITARKIFINGSGASIDYPIYVSIGGKLESARSDPWQIGYPTFSVFGNEGASIPVCKFIYPSASWTATGNDAMFHFHTESQNTSPSHYIFRITKALVPPFVQGLFNIDSNGDANIGSGKAYNTGGADAAEWLDTVEDGEEFEVGTVLIINEEGKLEPSSIMADTRVVGVVSDKPGIKLGSPGDAVELGGVKPKDKALVAAIGKVPVRCRADNGPIHPGSLLVSGPGGCAMRGSSSTPAAAILGKAIGTLKSGEGKVEALVSW